MSSPVFTGQARQLALPLREDLISAHRSVRDCIAQGVYQRGLKAVAADLDESPGNLSVQLSDDTTRKFSVDQLERYIQCTGDKTPIHYLVAKYLGDEGAARDQALNQVVELLKNLPDLMAVAGLDKVAQGRR